MSTGIDTAEIATQVACCADDLGEGDQRAQLVLFRLLTQGEPVETAQLATQLGLGHADVVERLGRASFGEDTIGSFCRFVHFFGSPQAADAWTRRHPGTFVISIAQGFEIGRRTNAAQLGAALAELATSELPETGSEHG